ncbi:excisionase family DNA-binding protein [Kribbella sp. NPDC056861]|uniref:excisionase family DNA-binding protein n=1 Tax=Kribbella sp. NPDC056861 TaxID=3154857 RepID=UPI003440513B
MDVTEAAMMLGTFNESGVRYPRRLIAERRIEFVKLGSKVRIPESAIREHIENNTVQPIRLARMGEAA